MASGFSTKTGKKYGFVSAADVKIGAVRGSNTTSHSTHMPMHRVGVIRSWSPGMTTAGDHYLANMPSAQQVSRGIVGGVEKGLGAYNAYSGGLAAEAIDQAVQARPKTARIGRPAPLAAGYEPTLPTFAPGVDSLDTNRPPSPLERQAARLAPVAGVAAQRLVASRVGKFAEGRLEKKVDRLAGHGAYSNVTGRGTRLRPPPQPF